MKSKNFGYPIGYNNQLSEEEAIDTFFKTYGPTALKLALFVCYMQFMPLEAFADNKPAPSPSGNAKKEASKTLSIVTVAAACAKAGLSPGLLTIGICIAAAVSVFLNE